MVYKIDKGLLVSFVLLIALVALVGALFFTQYIFGITLGTVFQATANFTATGVVVNESFLANTTAVQLDNVNMSIGSLTIYNNTAIIYTTNATGTVGSGNFTIDFSRSTIALLDNVKIANGTNMNASYSYAQHNLGPVPLTTRTRQFLSSNEGDYITTAGFINSGSLFAGGLIVVAVVIVVFGSILMVRKRKGKGGKGQDY